MAEQIKLTKSDRLKVCWRSTFLQGSWNYERMQNGGWTYSLIPAIKKLYPAKKDRVAALKRHMEFFNTHTWLLRFWVWSWRWKKNARMGPQLTTSPFKGLRSA